MWQKSTEQYKQATKKQEKTRETLLKLKQINKNKSSFT